jgi:hypothetical protein
MADSAIVLILLLAGDAADPATQAAISAVRRPLGEEAVVLVRPSETRPTDDEALALARQVHALSAVTVDWEDSARSRVRVRMQLADGARRYDYELAFKPEDQPAERGRAVGLALTPVLMRAISATHSAGASAQAAGGPPGHGTGQESTRESPAPPALPPPPAAVPADSGSLEAAGSPSPRAREPAPSWFALDITSAGSVGIGGNALALGPALGARAYILGPLALHGVAVARFGAVDAASASAATIGMGGGASFRALRLSGKGLNLEAGLRVDVLAMQIALSQDVGSTSVRRSRWLTAVDFLAEVAWPLQSHFALMAAGGAEIAAGPTTVSVGGAPVDHIPTGRVVAELGVRIPF